jgi:hypothetical protein
MTYGAPVAVFRGESKLSVVPSICTVPSIDETECLSSESRSASEETSLCASFLSANMNQIHGSSQSVWTKLSRRGGQSFESSQTGKPPSRDMIARIRAKELCDHYELSDVRDDCLIKMTPIESSVSKGAPSLVGVSMTLMQAQEKFQIQKLNAEKKFHMDPVVNDCQPSSKYSAIRRAGIWQWHQSFPMTKGANETTAEGLQVKRTRTESFQTALQFHEPDAGQSPPPPVEVPAANVADFGSAKQSLAYVKPESLVVAVVREGVDSIWRPLKTAPESVDCTTTASESIIDALSPMSHDTFESNLTQESEESIDNQVLDGILSTWAGSYPGAANKSAVVQMEQLQNFC